MTCEWENMDGCNSNSVIQFQFMHFWKLGKILSVQLSSRTTYDVGTFRNKYYIWLYVNSRADDNSFQNDVGSNPSKHVLH